MTSPNVLFTFWDENYQLVFNELKGLITRKAEIMETVNDRLASPNFHIDSLRYDRHLEYSQQIDKEINTLKACLYLFPEIKAAYDTYLRHMTLYRDGEINVLKIDNYVLRLKLKKHGINEQ